MQIATFFLRIFAAMKRIIFMVFLLIFAACTPSVKDAMSDETPSPKLSAIDSLMWQRPDSALAVLLDFAASPKADSLDVFDGHYTQLLASELLYKNDYQQSNRTELRQAVSYFDSLMMDGAGTRSVSLPFLTARAHYINGVGFYERDSVVEACKEYIKALEFMEEYFDEKELVGKKARFIALIYTRLTVLFSDLYLHKQAIYFGKFSLPYYRTAEASPRHIAWVLDEIGAQYDMIGSNDTASIYYCDALNILPDTNNITYRDIVTHLAFLSYKKKESPSASLMLLQELATKAESDKEFFSRCMNIGEIFYHEKLFDSAWIYLSRVFHESQNVNSKKQAAEWLVAICKTQGKVSEMLEYADFLVPFANQEENTSEIKSQLTEIYKTFIQEKLERQHRKETRIHIKQALTVITGMLFVILIISLLYHKNRKHKQHLETLIESERQTHKIQQKALSGRLKKSNEALHDALKQLNDNSVYNELQSDSKPVQDYISFVETPICVQILETVRQQRFKSKIDFLIYKEYALQKGQLLALRVAADEKMGCFTIRLKKHFPSLTEEDITYCCLYLLDISDADIAALMQKAYPTVCERKRKIKRIVGGENNFSFTLRNLPN